MLLAITSELMLIIISCHLAFSMEGTFMAGTHYLNPKEHAINLFLTNHTLKVQEHLDSATLPNSKMKEEAVDC